jgi:squalene-hopene/tetraprenyl-beta-curcumene cyclase
VFTRIWLALVGQWEWEDLPVVPPEIMFLPAWVPLNIYDFACWARQTVVALTVVMAHRPVRPLPFRLDELDPGPRPGPGPDQATSPGRPPGRAARLRALRSPAGRFEALDRVLHRYERLPAWFAPRTLARRAALGRAERWILRRQEADGLWGGIQPPVVYSMIALHLLGYPIDHPVMQAALAGLDGFTINEGGERRIEACQSPVWDTALAVVALSDAGVDPAHPALESAVRWLCDEEVTVTGDWAVRRPALAPGGWAFEFANDNYPDVDDTAEVIMALRQGSAGRDDTSRVEGACTRGVAWTVGMRCRDGGWAAFDADNDSSLVASLPFCDFGEVTDPPSADVTAHVVEMLAREPGVAPEVLERGVQWLWDHQEADGSWFGRWGVNYVYGTGAAVPALVAAGVSPGDARIRRAVAWLEAHQNSDGGWGEDLRSYIDENWRGRGTSTASQTAWALLALLAAGEHESLATRQGVAWLVQTQTAQGTWDEPWFTGTGFPWDFSINYHLYRLVWPVMALGRHARAVGETEPTTTGAGAEVQSGAAAPAGPASDGEQANP